jgi:hypothetical protein
MTIRIVTEKESPRERGKEIAFNKELRRQAGKKAAATRRSNERKSTRTRMGFSDTTNKPSWKV